jgi:hypothetical protein
VVTTGVVVVVTTGTVVVELRGTVVSEKIPIVVVVTSTGTVVEVDVLLEDVDELEVDVDDVEVLVVDVVVSSGTVVEVVEVDVEVLEVDVDVLEVLVVEHGDSLDSSSFPSQSESQEGVSSDSFSTDIPDESLQLSSNCNDLSMLPALQFLTFEHLKSSNRM